MLIYIASPYTIGNQENNVLRQLQVAEVLSEHGFYVHCPLLNHHWNKVYPHTENYWLTLDLAILKGCDALLRLPGESKGADIEVNYAKQRGIPVYLDLVELIENCK